MNLQGRNAIVTGGAVRLGRAIAVRLAAEGANVCIHYCSSGSAADSACAEIAEAGGKAVAVSADFRDPVRSAKQVMEVADAALGPIDVLINSAAIFEAGTLITTDEAHWDRHFAINLKAPFFMSQQFALRFQERTEGAIINIADWRATTPVTGHLAYTMSKAALVTQTRLLAQELGPAIRVNALAPGAILPAAGTSAGQFRARAQCNPLQRVGSTGDISDGVVFLLRSDFITGEVIHVSGGEHLAPGTRFRRSRP